MKDESPPMLAIYLLLAFLSLQYASNLFGTNQRIYEREAVDYRKLQEQLQQIREAIAKPEATPTPEVKPAPAPIPKPTPPVVVKKKNNKISRSEELRATPQLRVEPTKGSK